MKNLKKELKLIHRPEHIWSTTAFVIAACGVCSLLISMLDTGMAALIGLII